MEETSSRLGDLGATLWSIVFAVSLLLAAAHVATSTIEQGQQESELIAATFTRAP
jgi:hypothetical protein